ncbi:AAA family ATPase [Desulfovibrio sp.]|uniref:cobyrinate/hydrogenobyrinate a,c-diamide synthase n=1 Tax=Desulfovibrio sp. TaxID=885 RepID=UPI0025C5FD3C|nr:AAA family ATPase [Desulfovibrio sp.]
MSHTRRISEGRNARPVPESMPRLCVTALSGGGGKTLLSLGLCRAFVRSGLVVQPFKKGPDYIDAAWLRLAAGRPAANLDPYFLEPPRLRALFVHAMQSAAAHLVEEAGAGRNAAAAGGRLLGLVEGNRGFFDGMDARGSCSTAELSRVLSCPVIISVDCTKMTRTAAALVRGMLHFETGIRFAGVVLNQVGSSRHERILRQALEEHTDVPVLGALPRLAENPLPERHMGIASCGDSLSPQAQQVLDRLADFVSAHVDMPRVFEAAANVPPLEAEAFWPEPAGAAGGNCAVMSPAGTGPDGHAAAPLPEGSAVAAFCPPGALGARPRIGYVRDAALWFYYEENLEALRRAGADLVQLSLLDAEHRPASAGDEPGASFDLACRAPWPQVDGLYLGGGFPEDHAEALSCSPLLGQLAVWAELGMPIYAECGGFMVLSRGIERQETVWPMSGILPVTAVFCPKPQGLGYVRGRITAPNPFFAPGTDLRGHEFHYSRCRWEDADGWSRNSGHAHWAMQLDKGQGMGPPPGSPLPQKAGKECGAHTPLRVDGLVFRNVWASYTHIFAPAAPGWAENFVNAARSFAARNRRECHE